jgi:hypothetical protein
MLRQMNYSNGIAHPPNLSSVFSRNGLQGKPYLLLPSLGGTGLGICSGNLGSMGSTVSRPEIMGCEAPFRHEFRLNLGQELHFEVHSVPATARDFHLGRHWYEAPSAHKNVVYPGGKPAEYCPVDRFRVGPISMALLQRIRADPDAWTDQNCAKRIRHQGCQSCLFLSSALRA